MKHSVVSSVNGDKFYGVIWNDYLVIQVNQTAMIGEVCIADKINKRLRIVIDGESGVVRRDKKEDIRHVIIDLTAMGDRWEGGSLDGKPFGWGSLFDENSKLVYEGFMVESRRVCYGTEFYPNNDQVKYKGYLFNNVMHGLGVLFDKKGTIEYNGEWHDGNCDIPLKRSITSDCSDSHCFFSSLEEITIGWNCCNDNSITSFSILFVPCLKKLEIGDKCFVNAIRFSIVGLNDLKLVKIGMNCFGYSDDVFPSENRDFEFHLTDCSSLESLEIGRYSFSDYYVFDLKRLTRIKSIIIGDKEKSSCFFHASSVTFIDLPSLETIKLGNEVFMYCQSVQFENLPKLKSILLGPSALHSDNHDDRKSRSLEPFNFLNTLSMKNLPSLNNFSIPPGLNLCYIGSVTIENIPNLSYYHIYCNSSLIFQYVHNLKSRNAVGLDEFIHSKSKYIECKEKCVYL